MKRNIIMSFLAFLSVCGCGVYVLQHQKAKDINPPEIQVLTDQIHESISATDDELTKYVEASDPEDGDVSDSLLIEHIEKNSEKEENAFFITYAAFDEAGNSSEITTDLYYDDYRKPHFALLGELQFAEGDQVNLFNYFTADDCLDGDITPFISIEGAEDLMEEKLEKGTYRCTASVVNSVGDMAVLPFEVEVYEYNYIEQVSRPYIMLTEYVTYLQQGEEYDPVSYLDHVEDDGYQQIDYGPMVKIKGDDNTVRYITEQIANGSKEKWVNISEIGIESNVDTEKKGVYRTSYSYVSSKKGYSCTCNQIVVVE